MNCKQKALAVAVATLLGAGLPSLSYAGVDFTKDAPEANAYAKEIVGDFNVGLGTITIRLAPGKDANAQAIPPGATYYATLKLNNAEVVYNTSSSSDTDSLYFMGDGASAGTLVTGTYADGVMPTGGFQIGTTSTAFGCGTDTAGAGITAGTATVNFSSISKTKDAPAGSTGNNYIIYELVETSPATQETNFIAAGCTVVTNIPNIKILDPTKPVTLVYALHTNIYFANNDLINEAAAKKEATIVDVRTALSFKAGSTGKDATASVTSNFGKFKLDTNAVDDKTASAGAIVLKTNTVKNKVGDPIQLGNLLGGETSNVTSTTLQVDGDFSSIYGSGTDHKVFISPNLNCASGTASPAIVGAPQATSSTVLVPTYYTFPIGGNMVNWTSGTGFTDTTGYLCFQLGANAGVSSTTTAFQIAETTEFKATLKPATNSDYNVVAEPITLKRIKRDGTVLEAAFLGSPVGYNNRVMLVHLNKDAMTDAKFHIKLRSDLAEQVTGTAAPSVPYFTQKMFTGTIKRGTVLHIPVSDIVSFPVGQGKTRVTATFAFEANNEDVQGVVQNINNTTKEIASLPMNRQGGCDGGALGGCGK